MLAIAVFSIIGLVAAVVAMYIVTMELIFSDRGLTNEDLEDSQ